MPTRHFMLLLQKAIAINDVFLLPETLDDSRFEPTYFTRNRKMPFLKLLRFMLSGRKAATQAALDEFFKLLGEGTHMSQQAYSKARNHFDHTPFSKAFYHTRDLDYADDNALG